MKKQSNLFFLAIIFILCCIIFAIWPRNTQMSTVSTVTTVTDSLSPRLPETTSDLNIQIVQGSMDTVRNPYAPPLRYSEDTYTQVGYISRGNHKHILFGKPAQHRRDKWYYYTIIQDIKLPIEVNKRKCTVSPGCDSVSTKDKVTVDGEEYSVTMYETDLLYSI